MRRFWTRAADGDPRRHGSPRLGFRLPLLLVIAFAILFGRLDDAVAQCGGSGSLTFGPQPNCTQPSTGQVHNSTNPALLDVGSQFLQQLGAVSSFHNAASAGNNPQGGGAEAIYERYRVWFEGYGLASHTDATNDYAGDRRRTFGGVAGLGVTVAPGVTLGLSVDQSHTKVDVSTFSQNGRIDLTQVGALAAFEHGPWNLGIAVAHGLGHIHSDRFDTGGTSSASYFARLWGAMAELTYYQALPNNSWFVPKLAFDWMHARSDPFTETGGVTPVTGTSITASRIRLLVGGELGHTWLAGRTLFDFFIYGRLVDNIHQDVGTLTVSDLTGGAASTLVNGFRESTLGADAGATFSAKVTEMTRLYLAYDGRFRSNFVSHAGTVGAQVQF